MNVADGELQSLVHKVRSSEYILVIVGAGLSRPSGLPTFREDPGFWDRPVEQTATRSAFEQDPIYVWTLYERLRLMSLQARPNPGHMSLVQLAAAKPGLLTVSQNIDGMYCSLGTVLPLIYMQISSQEPATIHISWRICMAHYQG